MTYKGQHIIRTVSGNDDEKRLHWKRFFYYI